VKTEIRRVGVDNDVDDDGGGGGGGGGDRTMMVGETFTTQLDAVNNDRHLQPSNKDHFDDDLLPSYELADTIMRGIRDIELSLTTSEIHHQSSSIEKHGPHRYGDSNNSSSNKDRMYNFGMEEDEVIVPPLGRKEIRVKRSKSNNRMIGAAFIVDDNHSDDSNDDKDDDDDNNNGNNNHIPSSIKKSFIRSSRLRDRSLSSSLLLHTARNNNNNNNNTQFMDFTRISFNPNSIENRAYASKRTINVTSTTTHATTTVAAAATTLSTTTSTTTTSATTTTSTTTAATSTSAVVTTTSTVLPSIESIASPSHKLSQSITYPHSTAPTSPSSALVLSLQPLHHDALAPTTTSSSTTITTTTPTTFGERRTRHMNSIIYESSTTAKLSSRTSSKLLRGSIMSTGAQQQHLSSQHLSGQHLSGQHLSGQHLSGQHLSDRQMLGSAMTAGGKESPMMQTQVTFVNNDSNYHIHYDRNRSSSSSSSSSSSNVRKIHSPLSIDPDGNSNINTEAMIAQLRQATVYDSTRQPFPPLKLDEVVNIITNIVHPLTTTTTIPSPQSSVQPSPVRKSPRAHKVGAIVSKSGFSSIDWSTPSNKPNCYPVLWSIGSSGHDHDPTVDQHHTHLNHHHQPHQQHGDNIASVNQNTTNTASVTTTTTNNNTPNRKLSRHMNPQSPTQQQQQSPIIAQHNLPVDYTAMMENRIESIIVNNLDSIIKHTTPAVDGGAIDFLSVAGQKRNTDQKSSNREKVTNARLYM